MIRSISFRNFKALRATKLPLGRFTLLVGPNGSGKSTALQALEVLHNAGNYPGAALLTAGATGSPQPKPPQITVAWDEQPPVIMETTWPLGGTGDRTWRTEYEPEVDQITKSRFLNELGAAQVYTLDPRVIPAPVGLDPRIFLSTEGAHLAGVLDRLRDDFPERFEAFNEELGKLLPEYDRVLFDTPSGGKRAFSLRTREGQHRIPGNQLSHGTLFVLVMLAMAYLSEGPPIVGIEEPDRGIHPRMLRSVRDLLYRLAYPEQVGEKRPPIQVIATTQSPYFLDLFREHPEEIVIAQKEGIEARFEPLSEREDIKEILADAPLGEIWYSGVLGGVPSNP